MDCPCEERLIRMAMESVGSVLDIECDLNERTVLITHWGDHEVIAARLKQLSLGESYIRTAETEFTPKLFDGQRRILIAVLVINLAFFIVEMVSGLLANSMGLVADSLDMLADALVYGMSLIVVGAALKSKKRVATLSGYFQIVLALWGLSEVVRRFIGVEEMPAFQTMIVVSLLALVANSFCLWLLLRTQSKEAHIRASVIFSANDVVINAGVICAGVLVRILDSNIPDLLIGIIVFAVVIRGAIRILKL